VTVSVAPVIPATESTELQMSSEMHRGYSTSDVRFVDAAAKNVYVVPAFVKGTLETTASVSGAAAFTHCIAWNRPV
jgi:hypothetical protein